MTTRKLAFLVLACCLLVSGKNVSAQLIFSNDFEDDPFGTYTRANLDADWNSPSGSNGVEDTGPGTARTSIVSDGTGGKALQVQYPAGEHGSGDDATGAQWRLQFDQGYEAVEVEYRVRFGSGFDFVRGGKLPGLTGGIGNVGGNKPDGTDGFSARFHWRTDGSSGSPLRSNQTDRANLTQYLYHPDQPTNFGEDFFYGPANNPLELTSDRWYHFRSRIILNTPGQNDGIVQGWVDGQQLLDLNNIRFRDIPGLQIDGFFFSTFFGGSGSQWNTTADEVAFFDDIRIRQIAVPEPSSLSLLMFSVGLVSLRRLRKK